ncbi:MAG: hypothetical protein HY650_04645 [Acidobacteria bacterium]|nr:hypothetical protein [Acidobacteriota bacterium]
MKKTKPVVKKSPTAQSVDDYLAGLPPDVRAAPGRAREKAREGAHRRESEGHEGMIERPGRMLKESTCR